MTYVTRKFRNVERDLHCDVLHIATVRVARLVLDCNGVFVIKAYRPNYIPQKRVRFDVFDNEDMTVLLRVV